MLLLFDLLKSFWSNWLGGSLKLLTALFKHNYPIRLQSAISPAIHSQWQRSEPYTTLAIQTGKSLDYTSSWRRCRMRYPANSEWQCKQGNPYDKQLHDVDIEWEVQNILISFQKILPVFLVTTVVLLQYCELLTLLAEPIDLLALWYCMQYCTHK